MMTVEEMIEKAAMEINLYADKKQIKVNELRREAVYSQLALENDDIKTAVKIACDMVAPILLEKGLESLTDNETELLYELRRVCQVWENNNENTNEPKNP